MTVRKCFGKSVCRSDVKQLFLVIVLLSILDTLPLSKGDDYDRGKEDTVLTIF